ncbi:MAG: hypothetical protein SFV15_25835 [Polyangiaceae bacterium]|nr:hypothetical protein [Polyangiaceae bacterium]
MSDRKANLEITWPLFDTKPPGEPIPASPIHEVSAYAPPSADLVALEMGRGLSPEREARSEAEAKEQTKKLSGSLPPGAPDWMLAARALTTSLEALIARGVAEPAEQAAVARTWAAWSLGGATESHILRVSHLVSRTHAALHSSRLQPPSAADLEAAAGVLYQGLPSVLQARIPKERVVLVVAEIARTEDAWTAVVECSAELLGWKHYGRVHAASAIRRVMERAGKHVGN